VLQTDDFDYRGSQGARASDERKRRNPSGQRAGARKLLVCSGWLMGGNVDPNILGEDADSIHRFF
jgi:hypothetical protein